MMRSRMAMVLIILSALAAPATGADALAETRYCGAPARNAKGDIIRRADVIRAFQKIHPCPVTGLQTGACAGWQKDHIIPLAVGGCDAVSNLQWLPVAIKTCAGTQCKDRWERTVYLPVATP